MPSILTVANQIRTANVPALFLDTCALLDIIRSVKRRTGDVISAAQALRAVVSATPARCTLVISHLVRHEWNANADVVLAEADKHLSEMSEGAKHFHEACKVLGVVPGFPLGNYALHKLPDQLRDLSKQLLDSAVQTDADDVCSGRAMQRIINNTPPAKKGGEAKDCNILEEYLAICDELRKAGFSKKCVFCTSNTNDYGKPNNLSAALAADFASANLTYTTTLAWALREVTT